MENYEKMKKDIIETIKRVFKSPDNLGEKARKRIKNNFNDIKRKEKLKKVFLDSICGKI